MGRFSAPLAPQLADLAGVQGGQRAVDVGCGPGALTAELVARLGAEAVTAVDPSPPFVAAVAERHPGIEARRAPAEELPFADATFDVALAQLVVHFMTDPVAGLAEMRRVTRPGGVVATCAWDLAGERAPISVFWRAVRALDPEARDESHLAGARAGHLPELFEAAGLAEVEDATLAVELRFDDFETWWAPYTEGVGPAGAYLAAVDDDHRAKLRERCREALGPPPFTVASVAWAARGTT